MSEKLFLGNVVYGFDREVSEWMAERIIGFKVRPDVRALGVVRDGKLVAGVAFEEWNGVHVYGSIAVDNHGWANKETMFRIFYYPFETLGVEAITALIASSNPESLQIVAKMGFKPEAMVQYAAHDGSTLVAMKMMKSECRWLDYGKRQQQRTESARSAEDGGSGSAIQPS